MLQNKYARSLWAMHLARDRNNWQKMVTPASPSSAVGRHGYNDDDNDDENFTMLQFTILRRWHMTTSLAYSTSSHLVV